jgi:hypothetical protein
MQGKNLRILAFAGVCALAGCNHATPVDRNAQLKDALNNYYAAHPACLWQNMKKFPVQAATSNDAKTQGYDALTDAGLLIRTTAEKKQFLIGSRQVNNYDLSPQGRREWTVDPAQPGYGNFCYAHREVTSIDNVSQTENSSGQKTAVVNYHFRLTHIANWAQSPEIKTAFPRLASVGKGSEPGQTTLVWNGAAWQMSSQSVGIR